MTLTPAKLTQIEPGEFQLLRPPRVKVMISSRSKELAVERGAAAQAVEDLGCEALVFERLEASGRSTEEESVRLAAQCNIYVLVVGETHSSIVSKEYETAKKHLREEILVFVREGPRDGQAAVFVDTLETLHTRKTFQNAADLAIKVKEAVQRVLEDALLERQARPPREAFGAIWDESFVLKRGTARFEKFMALRGDRTSGIAEGNDNFDVFLMDEPNYANFKASKRYDALLRERNRKATDLSSTIPHDGFYYLWIETGALGYTAIKVEFRRQNKPARHGGPE